jgi:hypothetical protein
MSELEDGPLLTMNTRKALRHKPKDTRASKQESSLEREASVTIRSRVTRKFDLVPSKRYEILEPWLWLANTALRRPDGELLPPEAAQRDLSQLEYLWDAVLSQRGRLQRSGRERSHYVEPRRRTRLRASVGARPVFGWKTHPIGNVYRIIDPKGPDRSFSHTEMLQWLCQLAHDVASSFHFYVRRGPSGGAFATAGGLVKLGEHEGKVVIEESDPYADFVRALNGAQIDRICQCPVCDGLFYAVRTTQGACSKRCNQTRRVREWRSEQRRYEQNRKFKLAGVKPEGVTRR